MPEDLPATEREFEKNLHIKINNFRTVNKVNNALKSHFHRLINLVMFWSSKKKITLVSIRFAYLFIKKCFDHYDYSGIFK